MAMAVAVAVAMALVMANWRRARRPGRSNELNELENVFVLADSVLSLSLSYSLPLPLLECS